jgi:hypothetical protein
MRSKAVLVALLTSLLAGCSGTTPPAEDGHGDVGVITDPKDLTNRTGEHVHDYWGGKDALEVVNAEQSSTWNNVGGRWRRTFIPADGVVVPQGTASINVSVDWGNDVPLNNYGPVSLWVKPANTVEPRFVALVPEGPMEVAVAYEEADLPHQLISAWEFIVQYNSSATYNAFFGTTQVVATAHRGHELLPFPAHPDRWDGRSEIPLADRTQSMNNVGYIGSGSGSSLVRMLEGAVVPQDAGRVHVQVDLAGAQPAPAPAGWIQVQYHAADSWSWVTLGVVSTQAASASWDIDVAPGMGDGPYNNASLWQFRLTWPTVPSADPAVHVATYHLVAAVHRE